MHGDAAESPFRQGLVPAGLLGDEIQDAQVTLAAAASSDDGVAEANG
jgi:hypothetical protein